MKILTKIKENTSKARKYNSLFPWNHAGNSLPRHHLRYGPVQQLPFPYSEMVNEGERG